jgi:hypothetical protein
MGQDIPESKDQHGAQAQELETISPSNSSRQDEQHVEKGGEDDGYIHQQARALRSWDSRPMLTSATDELASVPVVDSNGFPMGGQPDPAIPLRQRFATDILGHWWRGPICLVRHRLPHSECGSLVRHNHSTIKHRTHNC